jgi:hypothetical protein
MELKQYRLVSNQVLLNTACRRGIKSHTKLSSNPVRTVIRINVVRNKDPY